MTFSACGHDAVSRPEKIDLKFRTIISGQADHHLPFRGFPVNSAADLPPDIAHNEKSLPVRKGFSSFGVEINYTNRLNINAFPDPDFKYFSKKKALYLSVKTICVTN